MKNVGAEIKTTGQLRHVLANAVKGVLNGDMDIDRALALHKLSKNIAESLYSEAKIAILQKDLDKTPANFGELQLGDPSDK